MTVQLSLFTPAPPELAAATWHTGVVPYIDSEMRQGYVHLVRAPDDPERISRDEAKALGIRNQAPHRTLDETPVIEWKRLIRNLLVERNASTGHPAADKRKELREAFTFNRIALELAGITADVAFQSTPDAAAWELASWVATACFRTRSRLPSTSGCPIPT